MLLSLSSKYATDGWLRVTTCFYFTIYLWGKRTVSNPYRPDGCVSVLTQTGLCQNVHIHLTNSPLPHISFWSHWSSTAATISMPLHKYCPVTTCTPQLECRFIFWDGELKKHSSLGELTTWWGNCIRIRREVLCWHFCNNKLTNSENSLSNVFPSLSLKQKMGWRCFK